MPFRSTRRNPSLGRWLTPDPHPVRAELVEALLFLRPERLTQRKEQPFDKLRANGNLGAEIGVGDLADTH